MALQGTIGEFGAAQIFQLIASQRKTGRLHLSNGADDVRVLFKDGEIVGIEHDTRPQQMRLGSMLAAAELITAEELQRALDEHTSTSKPIGRVLLDLQLASPEVLARFLDLQAHETIDVMLQWSQGRYEFESAPVAVAPGGMAPLSAESVVMSGIRVLNDWPAIREKLPPFDTVLERARELPPLAEGEAEDANAAFELVSASDPTDEPTTFERIERNDRLVHALIGPGRDIYKIISLSQLGTFETCRALSTLIAFGYVTIPKPKPVEKKPAAPRPFTSGGRRSILLTSTALIALLLVGRIFTADRDPGAERRHDAAQLRALARMVEAYRLETGVYPKSLSDLIDASFASDRDIAARSGKLFEYRRTPGGGYLLDYPAISQ